MPSLPIWRLANARWATAIKLLPSTAKEEPKEEAVPVQDTHTVWEPQEIEEAEWDNDPEQENAEDEGFVDESGEETLQEYEDEYQEEAYDDYDEYEEYSDEDDWGDEILEDDWDEE